MANEVKFRKKKIVKNIGMVIFLFTEKRIFKRISIVREREIVISEGKW